VPAAAHALTTHAGQLEACLGHIFAKYCTPAVEKRDGKLLTPPPNGHLSREGLDEWAQDTNGVPFSKETKEELIEFLDVTDDGGLTCVARIWGGIDADE
jgi:hypothetical protein